MSEGRYFTHYTYPLETNSVALPKGGLKSKNKVINRIRKNGFSVLGIEETNFRAALG